MRKTVYNEGIGQEKFIIPLLSENILKLLKSIRKNESAEVLDIGCGNQPFRTMLTQYGWNYESLDISQNSFENVDYISGIDEEVNISKKFDLLFCTEVLEHVLFWEKAFVNFNKLTKKSGCLLLTVPFFYPPHEEPFDYWRPTHYAIEAFAHNNGFKIIESHKAGDAWDLIGTLCYTVFLRPKKRSFKSKILYMLLYRAQKWLKVKLEKEVIQKNVEVGSKYYLSNIFLFKKESE